MPVYIVF